MLDINTMFLQTSHFDVLLNDSQFPKVFGFWILIYVLTTALLAMMFDVTQLLEFVKLCIYSLLVKLIFKIVCSCHRQVSLEILMMPKFLNFTWKSH